ncbi:MAG: TrkA C-terminal domain-containing protein [Alphaproteobacteria bacterium]
MLLQITNGFSVAEHYLTSGSYHEGMTLSDLCSCCPDIRVLGIERVDGSYLSEPEPEPQTGLLSGDRIVLYCSDAQRAALG